MVDINLFKEDGEDEKEWTPDDNDQDSNLDDPLDDDTLDDSTLGDSSLDDDFNLDDDSGDLDEVDLDKELDDDLGFDDALEETSSIADDDLLADDDTGSDFDDTEDYDEEDEDYNYGEETQRKASPVLLIILGVVAVAAAVYQFVLVPQQVKKKEALKALTNKRPDVQQLIEQMKNQQAQTGDSTTVQDVQSEEPKSDSVTTQVKPVVQPKQQIQSVDPSYSFVGYLNKVNDVLENLSRQGQLGTIIMKDYDFHIGYVSEKPNTANAMAMRIKSLMGATNIKTSPEEKHRSAGKIRYWGVVSGRLPEAGLDRGQVQNVTFTTTDGLFKWAKELALQNKMETKQTETFALYAEAGKRYTPVRIKIEGGKAESMQLLTAFRSYQGNYILKKMVIAPVNISDFNARQVRVVLDISLRK